MTGRGALDGLTVVDASESLSGQMCSRLFADYGARVVLAEPRSGSALRRASGLGGSKLFWHLNSGKESVTVADDASLIDLCRGAHVAIAPQGRLAGQIGAELPELLLVTIHPFAKEGPYADWLGTELIYQALSGSMYVNGHEDRQPLYGMGHRASYAAGIWAYVGALAAMHKSMSTGRVPGVVEIAIHEAAVAMEQCFSTQWAQSGVNQRRGNRNRPKGMAEALDGWMVYFVMPGRWARFCDLFGAPELKEDERFSTWSDLTMNWQAATAELQARARTMTRKEIDEAGVAAGVPLAPILTPRRVWGEPQYDTRSFWVDVVTDRGARKSLGPVFRMSKTPANRDRPAPSEPGEPTGLDVDPPAGSHLLPGSDALPLEDLRVVDLTTAWAGPMAARILGFLGADVVKVEGVDRPDGWRGPAVDPPILEFYPDREPGADPLNRNTWFNSQNLDKRGVRIDLKHERGVGLLEELASESDIVLANTRPGVLERLGVAYRHLRGVNDRLVMVEMPAFGPGGHRAHQAALGPTMEALTGMGALIGYDDGVPVGSGSAYLDPIGALHGASAALTAIVHRDLAGEGQYVEVAQCEAAMHWIGEILLEATERSSDIVACGNSSPVFAPHGAFPALGDDEWVVIAVVEDDQWRALCRIVGLDRLADLGTDDRLARRSELERHIRSWTTTREKHGLARDLQRSGIPAAPVATGEDLVESRQLRESGWFAELDHPAVGPQTYPRLPFRFNGSWTHHRKASPMFGEHTDEVLAELCELSPDEIRDLRNSGVVA